MKHSLRAVLSAALLASAFSAFPTPAARAAYTFSSHTFTPCGATGTAGPTLANCQSAYLSSAWASSTSNLNMSSGIQLWTVPATGSYTISAAGAAGGKGYGSGAVGGSLGGSGAVMTGTFSLTEGTKIRILVGQVGSSHTGLNGGGGGGSFVMKESDNSNTGVLVIAGGGGGGGYYTNNSNVNAGTTTTSQTGWNGYNAVSLNNAASSGNGGATYNNGASGGAGLLANGATTSSGCGIGGSSFANGGSGGTGTYSGGFGGGGAGEWCSMTGGGGGGGYSGGSGGYYYGSGGGGGSYNTGTSQSNTAASNAVAGYVTITSLGPSVISMIPRAVLSNQSSVTYDISFSQSVSGVVAGDFFVSGSGSGTCAIGTPTGSATSYSVVLSGCSPGSVTLNMTANSVTNGTQTGPSSNTAGVSALIDQSAPTIASVSAPTSSTYSNNQTPTFTMVFNESVTVTGIPRLTLTVGSSTKYATFLALTDSRTATFRYTVTTDPIEFDTDGISVSTTVDLNGGSIADLATNAISNLTFTAPTLTSVYVAQLPVAPTIDSVVATSGTLTIYFTAGAARGSTTSGYQYTTDNNTFRNRETGTLASPLVITTVSTAATGLVNGTGYRIRIRAVTNAGNSSISNLVNETPTAISVLGDSTLTLTYGNSASTGAYSASGGTNTYSWSLGSTLTGITLSGTTVTAGPTTPAGTYSQSVRATDGNSQVGSKALTITVNKAATSITIALPNSATNAALGGAVTITATVPRAGAVNFRLGGTTLTGCGASAAASTTATCTWTPLALGSVALTAIFTPTDTANFETSTTTTLTITVVNGVSTVSLSLTGGVTQVPKGQAINIIAAIDQVGRITFLIDGKRIPGCFNILASVIGNRSCSWKPSVQKAVNISARLVPTNNVFNPSVSSLAVQVVRRSGAR